MNLVILGDIHSCDSESQIFQAIAESDPLGLGKQIAKSLDDMKGVEKRGELFYPSYTTAARVILDRYNFKGSLSQEMAAGISSQLEKSEPGSKIESQDISPKALQEVFGALSNIRGIVGELLRKADSLTIQLFQKENLHKGETIEKIVQIYTRAGEIAKRQSGISDRSDTLRVVRDTTPILCERILEIATVLDGVPFIRGSGRQVTTKNMKLH